MQGKYSPVTLLPALRLFIDARNRANEIGFPDNGGAIHSVERILDILCHRVKYPFLRHINSLKTHPDAECSVGAQMARQRGEKVLIEHVMPQRDFAKAVIKLVGDGATNEKVVSFIQEHYRLVLLSQEETTALNRLNRSRMTPNRLADAGIEIFRPDRTPSLPAT
ncbi:hypothetical protein ISN76_11220 [Dyella halodurans]